MHKNKKSDKNNHSRGATANGVNKNAMSNYVTSAAFYFLL
jgi:hypothetical protein